MNRAFSVMFLLWATACSGTPAVEPVMDATSDVATTDTLLDTMRHDDALTDGRGDGMMPDKANDAPQQDMLVDSLQDMGQDVTLQDTVDLEQPDAEVPDLPPPDLMPEGPTCYDYVECTRNSNCGPITPCPQCQQLLVGKVATEVDALTQCITTNCSGLEGEAFGTCIWTVCSTQWLDCIGGEGKGNCDDVLTCTSGCDEFSDSQCMELCVEMSDEDALELLAKIFADEAVSDGTKFGYVADCVGGQGDGACMDAMICMDACGENDPPCTVQCLKQTSPEALEKLKAMIGCDGKPCFEPAVECIGGTGTASCLASLQCLGDCNQEGDGGCFWQCLSNASAEAAGQLTEFSNCVTEKCGGVMENCPAAQECMGLCPAT